MGEALILETTFLVDLERELARGASGPAQELLESRENASLHITYTIAGELAAGASLSERDLWRNFVSPFRILPFNEDVEWQYGQSYRYLKEHGLLIGSNDLWTAATALAYDMPLVTRNRSHFRRVPGLKIASYGTAAEGSPQRPPFTP
ncbi:MAG TPA: type II toxin-antitoxin system VapC family toxin [Vicinamibacteria bacterium]|nr:type II toxin-antitoxin system VapC family toxin [Vicinamibacteria bacterium]